MKSVFHENDYRRLLSNLLIFFRKRASIPYQFRGGFSGPFGDDISKKYLNASQFNKAIAFNFHNPHIASPDWVDIHTKFASKMQ